MDSLVQDLRYAVRNLRNRPGFAVVAILTLAVGIGLNTSVFTTVDSALLRSLPYAEPERLVHLWQVQDNQERRRFPFAWQTLRELQASPGVFAYAIVIDKTLLYLKQAPLGVVLKAALSTASNEFIANHKPAACLALNVYIAAVKLAPTNLLTAAQKADLVADATRIKTLIGCPS